MSLNSAPLAGIRQAAGLRGFAAEFRDLDHYIRVITDRIWEGRRIDDIRTYYSDPCIVETPMSVSTSVDDVIAGTKATLVMFPDRRLLAEDIIQSGDAQGGFLSSHRIISPMTHLGDGNFGRATGARVHARTIADCVCRDNRIVHEWLVRDHAAIALQIASTPQALAQTWLNQRGGWKKSVAGPPPADYVSHLSTDPLAVRYAQAIEALASGRGDAAALYDAAAQQIGPGESTSYGHAEIGAFWRSVFGALPVQRYSLEHLALQRDMANSGRPDRVAMRFRAQTLHVPQTVDATRYGAGSGRPVEVLGIVHAEFVGGRVVREWVLIDDVAIWMQILLAQT
ncbi:MAG: ester cyclase [Rhodoferax sp.]|nr:ester cyclase [Rhodoferax sp.]